MQRPIKPEWLLRQADKLAGRTVTNAGAPINADLRRAVSAAYYALFHELTLTAASALLPKGTQQDCWRMARHFEHRAILRVCEWVVGPKNPPVKYLLLLQSLRNNQDILDIALAFQALQQDRHNADYNHEAEFARAEVLGLIDLSKAATEKVKLLKGTAGLQIFLLQMAITSRSPG